MRPLPQRTDHGMAHPSGLVMLSVLAVVMAGVAFWATNDPAETEQAVPISSTPTPSPSSSPTTEPSATPKKKTKPKKKQALRRDEVYVEVYNNSGITGLAGQVGATAASIGWQVVGSDNWYGTIPASTVYYPARLEEAGKQLALDLGIERTMPAVDPMRHDVLTVVLTADAA